MQQQPEHSPAAHRQRRNRCQPPFADPTGGGGLDADLFQLQPVVADKQSRRDDHRTLSIQVDLQRHPASPFEHRLDARQHRHPAVTAPLLLGGFPVLQQLRVQAQAGIDQKQAPVDFAHLHRLLSSQHQRSRRCFELLGNAVAATEKIEGSLWNDPQHAASEPGGLGHGVDGPVATDGHQHAAGPGRDRRSLAACLAQRLGRFNRNEFVPTPRLVEHASQLVACLLQVVFARTGVDDDRQQGLCAVTQWGTLVRRKIGAHSYELRARPLGGLSACRLVALSDKKPSAVAPSRKR